MAIIAPIANFSILQGLVAPDDAAKTVSNITENIGTFREVLQLLNGADYLSGFSESQLQTQIMLAVNNFSQGWEFGLIVFGFHLLLLGYLILKAGYMRKI